MKMLEKLLEKKKQSSGKELDPMYKDSKMSMLKALRSHMSGMMKDDLQNPDSMKKVEVAASSPEALADGLDKAKDMVGGSSDGMPEAPESPMDEMAEGAAGDEGVESQIGKYLEDPSRESLESLLMALQQKKMEMSEDDQNV